MDFAFTFVLLTFASFRLARLLVDEQAPFGLAQRLRDMFGASHLDCEKQYKAGVVTSVLCCVHCTGVWTSVLFVTLYSVAYRPLPPIEWGIWVLAVSGVVSWLYDR